MRSTKSNGLQSLLHDLNINPQYLTLAILACTVLLLIGAPMFDSLLGYIWNSPPPESSSSSYRRSSRKSTSSGAPRTRAEQLRQRGETTGGSGGEGSSSAPHIDDVYYPGLVNISGTYCFLNSTLQVSLSRLWAGVAEVLTTLCLVLCSGSSVVILSTAPNRIFPLKG